MQMFVGLLEQRVDGRAARVGLKLATSLKHRLAEFEAPS